jgi:hypothetical protein
MAELFNMNKTFILSIGYIDGKSRDMTVIAADKKAAHRAGMDSLSDAEKADLAYARWKESPQRAQADIARAHALDIRYGPVT